MSIQKSIILFLFFVSFNSGAQLFCGPEKTAKRFLKAAEKGDFEKASEFCILELKEDVDRSGKRNYRSEEFDIKTISCDVEETEYGVDCACLSEMSGYQVVLIYQMTRIDGKWKIYNIETEDMGYESSVSEQNKSNKKYDTPQQTLEDFAAYNLAKKYKKAATIPIMAAAKVYAGEVEKNPGSLPVSITNIFCYKADQKTACNCNQVTADGKSETAFYELILVDGKWKITEFGKSEGAEYVVRKFVTNLADGECALAKQLATGAAQELVQGTIDAGCTRYSTEILSVYCKYADDVAQCTCLEKRDGMEMTFVYDLIDENGRWLVTNYKKDFNMEEDSETPYAVESTEVVTQMDYDYADEEPIVEMETIVAIADIEAAFPGGNTAMTTYITNNIVYPESAKNSEIEGVVYVQFVVRTDGTITNVVVIKGINEELNQEALRIVNSMPNWTPGKVEDKVVPSYYTLPIRFQLTK